MVILVQMYVLWAFPQDGRNSPGLILMGSEV